MMKNNDYDSLSNKKKLIYDKTMHYYDRCIANGENRKGDIVKHAIEKYTFDDNPAFMKAMKLMNKTPCDIDEFIDSDEFLGGGSGEINIWPALIDDLKNINRDQMLGQQPIFEVLLGGATGCVDGETEYLSTRGWVKIKDHPKRTKVGQYNPETKSVEFCRPKEYIKKQCSRFYHFTGFGVDQVLSSEHRVYYEKDGEMLIKSAKTVAKMIKDGKFDGKFLTTFSHESKPFDLDSTMLRSMYACILNGKFIGQTNKCLIRNYDGIDRIKKLLNASKTDFEVLGNGDLYVTSNTFNDFLSNELYTATDEELDLLIQEYLLADRNGYKRIDSESADIVQYAFARLGVRCEVYNSRMSIYKETKVSPIAVEEIESTPNDPYKYCFEVDTSLLILRRNGKIFITGNTGKTFYLR